MASPLITAVIPAYNAEKTLIGAVASVVAQTFEDFELIIVNDGSVDGTLGLAESIDDHRVKVVSQENKGPGAARNLGLSMALGRWIAFLDADDTWEAEFFSYALKALSDNPSVLFFFGASQSTSATIHRPPKFTQKTHTIFRADHKATAKSLRRQTDLSLCLMLADRETINSMGGYYEKNKCTYGEDSLLSFLIFWNYPVIKSNKIVHTYNQSITGLSLSRHNNVQVRPMVSDPSYLYERLPKESHKNVRKYVAYLASIDAYRLAKVGFEQKGQQLISDNSVTKYAYQPTVVVSIIRFYFYKLRNQFQHAFHRR